LTRKEHKGPTVALKVDLNNIIIVMIVIALLSLLLPSLALDKLHVHSGLKISGIGRENELQIYPNANILFLTISYKVSLYRLYYIHYIQYIPQAP